MSVSRAAVVAIHRDAVEALDSVVAVVAAVVVVTDARRATARATTRNMTIVVSTHRDARVARARREVTREMDEFV